MFPWDVYFNLSLVHCGRPILVHTHYSAAHLPGWVTGDPPAPVFQQKIPPSQWEVVRLHADLLAKGLTLP